VGDTARHIEFVELRGDPAVEGRQAKVAGRCMSGPIRVGDRFTTLIDRDGASHTVDLGVLDIGLYGSLVFELDPVLAGELVLVGSFGNLALVGATLQGDVEDREFEEGE
jgi:hypothetical protein